MADSKADVIVIGAGVVGCAIAFELAKAGRHVLVLDRGPAAGYGSTSSSSAIVRGHYSALASVVIAYESALCWQQWADYVGNGDERGTARLVQVGTLLLKGPDGHYKKVLPLYDELGVPYENLSVDELQRELPVLDTRSFWPPRRPDDERFWEDVRSPLEGAVLTPWSGYVDDPQLATHNLQWAAQAAGAVFRFRAEVTNINSSRGRVESVDLDGGETMRAAVVVNAAGPHSRQINLMSGVHEEMRVTTRPLRQEVHHVPAPAGFDYERLGHHVSDPDLGIDFRPEPGNRISVGSEGPECDPKEWIDDPDQFERRVTEPVWKAQVYRLARRIPSLSIPTRPVGIADLYDVTDDWVPIYDKSTIDGYYMAIGTSGNQFKNAPTVGYLMSELITASEAGHDHDQSPLAVPGRYVDRDLELGYYTRLRTPRTDTSRTAMG
jgi:sarcosine oxidase subunit beta